MSSLRKICLFWIVAMCFFPNIAHSSESVTILALPFKINSMEDFAYLQSDIPNMLAKHLERDGATVIDSGINFVEENVDKIKNIGIQNRTDYVIWGSLTFIGQDFSMDAKMAESFGEQSPSVFFANGKGMENLSTAVKQLAVNIGMKIFKRKKIVNIIIEGNKRIEADAIKSKISAKLGDAYVAQNLSEDLKSVYSMGYFEDIRIMSEDTAEGRTIIFKVKEKSTIRVINIKGNKVCEDEEIRENLDINAGSILNVFKINSNIKRIEQLYKDKNYHNVKVAYNIYNLKNNQSDIEFVIQEGEELKIKEIIFKGNNVYSNKQLKKLMKSSEKGFFSWLTSSGELNTDDLKQDSARIAAFYHNNGYIQARVGDPDIKYQDSWIYIIMQIEEGVRFKVGKIDISGDMIIDREELIKKLKITNEEFYNRDVIRQDALALTDLYSDEGYAYTDIIPRVDRQFNPETDKIGIANINYVIDKGKQVYFEKIIITGNTKTRDKVIRRELQVYERELFGGKRLKRSIRNLYRLDFFEDIKVDSSKGSSDDTMVLTIDVAEKPTGMFSFGGGYSSVDKAFVMASISQKNLFGRGQILQLKAELGGVTNRFTLSFTEPWMFDIPLSAGFDLYNWEKDYDYYDKDSKGGGVRFGYPVYDFTRAYISYAYEQTDITNIDEHNAPKSIRDMTGTNVASSITASLRYDSRNQVFNPTEGQDHSITVEYAGLGGDIAFTKYLAEAGWYMPLFMGTVGFLHGRTGFVSDSSEGKLPDYERFYLGGMNSLRGFDYREISPTEEYEGDIIQKGGDKFIQFNFEFLVPLIKKAGLVGLIFYDTGDVYDTDENIDIGNLRKSAGYGFRWYSPIGPIRLENGYILDPKEGESDSGRWEFTMGTAF